MAQKRTKKRRNKKYTGENAKVVHKTVTHVKAPERSRWGEWWHDNRQNVAFRGAFVGFGLLLFGIIWLISRIFF